MRAQDQIACRRIAIDEQCIPGLPDVDLSGCSICNLHHLSIVNDDLVSGFTEIPSHSIRVQIAAEPGSRQRNCIPVIMMLHHRTAKGSGIAFRPLWIHPGTQSHRQKRVIFLEDLFGLHRQSIRFHLICIAIDAEAEQNRQNSHSDQRQDPPPQLPLIQLVKAASVIGSSQPDILFARQLQQGMQQIFSANIGKQRFCIHFLLVFLAVFAHPAGCSGTQDLREGGFWCAVHQHCIDPAR